MSRFIEVHEKGKAKLLNLKWVEEIQHDGEGSCTIYFAFTYPGGMDQDYIKPDESYAEIKWMIMEG